MILYFTSMHDANCRWMEIRIAGPALQKVQSRFICARLFVDGHPADGSPPKRKEIVEQIRKLQEKWLIDPVVPSFAMVTPDGKTVLATYIDSETKAGTFVQFLDDGWAKWEQFKANGGQANGKLTERGQEPLH